MDSKDHDKGSFYKIKKREKKEKSDLPSLLGQVREGTDNDGALCFSSTCKWAQLFYFSSEMEKGMARSSSLLMVMEKPSA